MNHTIFIVKIITNPVHLIYDDHHSIEIEVEFAAPIQKNFENELTLVLWGHHRDDFLKYYKTQDYLLIEGFLAVKGYRNDQTQLKIVARCMYPFLLH